MILKEAGKLITTGAEGGRLAILIVSPLAPPRGGMSTWTGLIVAEAGSRADVRLAVLDTAPRWREFHQMERWRRVAGGGMQLARDFFRLLRGLWTKHPGVVHLCSAAQLAVFRDLLFLGLARLHGVRTVYHLHCGRVPAIREARSLEWRVLRRAAGFANAVISLDAETARVLRAEGVQGVCQLPNCLDLEALVSMTAGRLTNRTAPSKLRITYLGMIQATKGVQELVEAAVQLREVHDFELELIGPADPDFWGRVRELGKPLGDRLLFRGEMPREQAMRALQQVDVFVLPSHTEGFPYVIMEAMALGRAIVATDVGAIREMLGDDGTGECGIVVPPRSLPGLVEGLGRMLSDPKLRSTMGARAKERAWRDYGSRPVFERLCQVWKGTASEGTERPSASAEGERKR